MSTTEQDLQTAAEVEIETEAEAPDSNAFHAILVVEGVRTTDRREFKQGSLSWRALPIPLLMQLQTSEGHKGSVVVGKITRIERREVGDGTNEIHGWGVLDVGSEHGREARRQIAEQFLRGISVDAELMEIDKELMMAGDSDEDPVLLVEEGRLMGATCVPFPAFPQAVIALGEDVEFPESTADGRGEVVSAEFSKSISDTPWDGSAARFDDEQWKAATAGCRDENDSTKSACFLPHHEPDGTLNRRGVLAAASRFNQVTAPAAAKARAKAHLLSHYKNDLKETPPDILNAQALVAHAEVAGPPSDWFDDPELKSLTPLTVARNGRIYGHLAGWNTCHIGYKDCMRPPKSRTGYSHFKVGQVFASGCDCEDGIATGVITLGTTHADVYAESGTARRHYDNTGMAVADVSVGEDAYGIWVAGALRPGVTESQIRTLRGSALSGDWRYIGGSMELIGILAVNTPGFPIPRTTAAIDSGIQVSLVAAGIDIDSTPPPPEDQLAEVPITDLLAELRKRNEEGENAGE